MDRNPTYIVAKLDLTDEGQRKLHDFIRRTHTGRWPMLRALAMRQIEGVIYEAVQWMRSKEPQFSVLRWLPDGSGVSWRNYATATEARQALKLVRPSSREATSGEDVCHE